MKWRRYVDEEGREIVECNGTLRDGGRPVLVRWHVMYHSHNGGSTSLAVPLFASVGGEVIKPPGDFAKALFGESGKKE